MRHLIHGESFKGHPISRKVHDFPAMLDYEERRLLSYLASNLASDSGKIVDLGCYLGGSTNALIEGVRRSGVACRSGVPVVFSYDMFVANQYMVDHSLGRDGLREGDSFQAVFRKLLGRDAELVREVAGDIREQRWGGQPIDLLFVDILWSWEINQHVISEFYGSLIPGRSVIAHQDYIYSHYPWLPISMEYLAERGVVEFGDHAKWGTVVFGVLKGFDREAISIDFRRDLDLDTKNRLISRSIERFEGYPRGILDLSRVILMSGEGRRDDALSLLADIERRWSHDEVVATHLDMVHRHLGLEPPCRGGWRVDAPHAQRSRWMNLKRFFSGSRSPRAGKA